MKSVRNLVWYVPSRNAAADTQRALWTEAVHRSLVVYEPFNEVVGPMALAVEDALMEQVFWRALGVDLEAGVLVWGSRVLPGR